eukprot:GHVQ01007221.1.p1 GENE.GHVQ01007221.1~~GHVQ01007221.1.p1  ORF type:complete len:113 (-),score=11.76 GHVQ01007221.1:9-347(-)
MYAEEPVKGGQAGRTQQADRLCAIWGANVVFVQKKDKTWLAPSDQLHPAQQEDDDLMLIGDLFNVNRFQFPCISAVQSLYISKTYVPLCILIINPWLYLYGTVYALTNKLKK